MSCVDERLLNSSTGRSRDGIAGLRSWRYQQFSIRVETRMFGLQTRSTPARKRSGSVFVEYLLLVTLVGIGVLAGLASVRSALVNELLDLANAINAINSP